MSTLISVKLLRWDVYRHLLVLTNQDQKFTFMKGGPKDDQLDALVVFDAKLIKKSGRFPGAVIGTMRLLPAESRTMILFLNKDVYWNMPIPEGGETLFMEYYQRVYAHFKEAGLIVGNDFVDSPLPTESHKKGESEPFEQNNKQYNLVSHSSTAEKLIDEACIGWAGRGRFPQMDMSEYLYNFNEDKGMYLTRDIFKDALKDAGKRGIIVKVGRYWKLP